jgi:hypothetical protein
MISAMYLGGFALVALTFSQMAKKRRRPAAQTQSAASGRIFLTYLFVQ